MAFRSGKKNALVSIYQTAETGRDPDYNTPLVSTTLWRGDLFCTATVKRGKEVVIEGEIASETYVRFEFEYFDVEGIEPMMTIVHEDVAYDIKAILKDLPLKEWIQVDTVTKPEPTGRT